jgi:hypothetical protein
MMTVGGGAGQRGRHSTTLLLARHGHRNRNPLDLAGNMARLSGNNRNNGTIGG